MSGPTDGKPVLRLIEGGRAQVERDIVRALAVGDDAGALAGMATLERRGAVGGAPPVDPEPHF